MQSRPDAVYCTRHGWPAPNRGAAATSNSYTSYALLFSARPPQVASGREAPRPWLPASLPNHSRRPDPYYYLLPAFPSLSLALFPSRSASPPPRPSPSAGIQPHRPQYCPAAAAAPHKSNRARPLPLFLLRLRRRRREELLLATAPAPALEGCTLLHREERQSERLQACWCACGCALLLLCSDLLHQPSRIRSSGDEHRSCLLGRFLFPDSNFRFFPFIYLPFRIRLPPLIVPLLIKKRAPLFGNPIF